MTSQTQSKIAKKQILVAKTSVLRSLNNEQALKYELTQFFENLKKEVLHELEEYYNDEFMFQAQADLILSPIFESQQEYYNILRKFNHKEYNFGRKTGRRLVKLARKKANRNSIAYADKARETSSILKATINKDELFGINPWSEQKLLNQSFTASERTMNRVDSDINKILSDGYREGKGINVVRNDITKRFDQLSSWEATRIARTEIHNAHNMGTMDIYQEMGVEYTQWIAAHDSRTRTSHLDVDREIIPMGGTYSNGLRYPGDTSGPLKEWINCRCSNAPFVIPDGYIAPSFSPFKEEDLIPTLDYWNQDDLIAQATQDAQESISAPSLSPEDESQMKDWYDMFHKVEQHEPPEVFYENTLKNRYLKSVEANVYHTEELTPRMLTEVKALEKYYPEQYNRMVKEITKEIDYNRLSPAHRANYNKLKNLKNLEPYQKEILSEYEKIARDTNIHAEEVMVSLNGSNPRTAHGLGSQHYDAKVESFIKYNFKDKNYSIYISKHYDDIERMSHQMMNVDDLIKRIEKQPKIIHDSYKKICFSSQRGIKHIESGRDIGGWSDTRGNVVLFTNGGKTIDAFLSHEGGHNLEEGIRKISKDPKFRNAFENDMDLRRNGKIKMTDIPEGSVLGRQSDDKIWISHYAEFPINSKNTEYIEAWADLVKAYVHEPKWLKQNYPKSYKYIDKMFKKYEKSSNGITNRVKKFFKRESKINAPTIDKIKGKGKNSKHTPKITSTKIKIKPDKEKVVKINGKKVYGVPENPQDQYNFLKKWAIKEEKLTTNEFKFVKLYSGEADSIIHGYYRDMAKAVTSHKQNLIKKKYSKEWESLKIKYKEYYIPFDEALKISKTIFKKGKILDEDLVVVRRQKSPLLNHAHYGVYHSDSLLSTTISKNVKPEIYGDYLAYIVIPKGKRIFYIEGITENQGELEILFGVGKNLRFITQKSELISHWELI